MSLRTIFIDALKTLASAEHQLTIALPKMATASSSKKLTQAFRHHLKETRKQTTRLTQAFTSIDEPHQIGSCKGMQGLIAEAAQLLRKNSRNIFGDLALLSLAQRVEHQEIGAYFSCISAAKTLGYLDAANLLVENLQEEQKAAELLTKLSKSLLKEAAAAS